MCVYVFALRSIKKTFRIYIKKTRNLRRIYFVVCYPEIKT